MEPKQWILEHAEALGVRPENVNPASVDLCLGEQVLECGRYSGSDVNRWCSGEEITLRPGYHYLCHTEEYTSVPPTHAWLLTLKSTPARKGIFLSHAGLGDPGFEGQCTFTLRVERPVTLKPGQRIVQLMYFPLTAPTQTPYGGEDSHYQGSRGVNTAWTEGDDETT